MRAESCRSALTYMVLVAGSMPALSAAAELISVRRSDIPEHYTRGHSDAPAMSKDARFIAFDSTAPNLVAGDSNGLADIFVYDRFTGAIERVSLSSDGTQGNGRSHSAAISGDGRFVAFVSESSSLVPSDTNQASDVFVHDRTTHATTRVSVSSNGSQARFANVSHFPAENASPSLSHDGRYVAFLSNAYNLADPPIDATDPNIQYPDVYVRDRQTGVTERVSVNSQGMRGDERSLGAVISPDGRLVAFGSYATNMSGTDSPLTYDVFVRDRHARTTVRLTAEDGASFGRDDVAFSGDSRFIAYGWQNTEAPYASIFVHDRSTGVTTVESVDSNGQAARGDSFNPSLSADGRFVAFASNANNLVPNDTNPNEFSSDVFIRDRSTGETKRVSVGTPYVQGNDTSARPVISGSGQFVVFTSGASNFGGADIGENSGWNIFLRNRATATTTLVSISSLSSASPRYGAHTQGARNVSSSGRYVAFVSRAASLVQGDTNGVADVFLRDRTTAQTERISVGASGVQGNGESLQAAITPNARYVTFASYASNLVAGDSEGYLDIFVRDRALGSTTRVTAGANGHSLTPAISNDGRYVAFTSSANNLVDGDTNGVADVFVRDQLTGVITRISVSTNGVQGNGTSSAAAISGDGRWIAFGSEATNLASGPTLGRFFKVFVRDRQNSRTTLVSVHPAGGASIGSMAALSENGGFVAYTGESDQLYVRNLAAGQTTVIMAGANPISGYSASLSADGRYVAFSAKEDPNNTDAPRHIRVWDRWTGRSTAVTPLTRPEGSVSYFTDSTTPSISPDGSTIAFTSEAQNLVSNDLNDERDVFVQARPSL